MVTMRAAGLLAASLLLAALPAAADAPVSLGKNLAGEACELSSASGNARPINCGGASMPAGDLRVAPLAQALPADISARHGALVAMLEAGETNEGEAVSCGDPQWLGGDDVLLVCTFQSNGWPHLILGSVKDGKLYRAAGLPSSLPALQAAMALASGVAVSPAEAAAAMRAVQAALPAEALRVGAADYTGYAKYIEAARLESGADDYAAAEANYRKALAVETRLFGEKSVIVGQTLAELALQVSNQGRFDEAQGLFQRATPLIQTSSSNAARARLSSYLALDAANRRDYTSALKFAREATAIRRADVEQSQAAASAASDGAPSIPPNEGELAHSLRIEAEMALRLGDLPSARAAAEEASLIVSQEPGLPLWWRPAVVSLMGEINEREGRVVAAEAAFRDARDLDKKLFGDNAPTVLADMRLGQFYSDQQLYDPSIAAYNEAFAILAKDQVARAIVVPDQIVPYIAAASATPGNDADMFRASQYANSSVADQTIALVAARRAAGNASLSDLIRQAQDAARARDEARMELAAEFAKPDDSRSGAREQSLQSDIQAASARADSLLVQVKQQFPEYASMANPGPVELKDVQAALGPHEAMIVFVIGLNQSYGLLVTRDGFDAQPLKISETELDADIADLRKAFAPTLGKLPPFSLKTSHDLYQALLAPFEAKLAGVDSLIVVPNGALANLPLSLLVTEAPAGDQNYAQAAWLVRRMAVSDVPSPRAFLSLREEREHHAPAPRGFLGVANPAYAGASGAAGARALSALTVACREEGPIDPALLRALPPLPETAGEVQTVAARLGNGNATVLSGGNATESALRGEPLDQFAVIYFATHGILPGELHCAGEPGLALSPPAGAARSTPGDGLLTASEIAGLRLNADLVVLSACNTAESGSANGGGSLEGLADSFFAAGARAVLASHWQVPSGATEHLMIGVFDRTGRGGSDLAQALRQSQLQLISQPATAHPFNWAAFTIIGDGETLAPSNVQSAKAGE